MWVIKVLAVVVATNLALRPEFWRGLRRSAPWIFAGLFLCSLVLDLLGRLFR